MKFKSILGVYAWSQSFLSLSEAAAVSHSHDFTPKSFITAEEVKWPESLSSTLILNSESPVATIDYGTEVAGFPFFEISRIDGPVQIEVKYSEPYHGLQHPWGDGPYTFSTGLSNAFRVETFNITKTGKLQSPLIQGGQRWQSIRLIAGQSVSFTRVGFVPTVSDIDPEKYPSQFHSDNKLFNEIWKLGAKAAGLACLEKGTQGPVWTIDPAQGALVQGMRASPNFETGSFENYTLQFETKIERAGLWWTVAQPMTYGSGLQLLLTGELPKETTFANINTTLTPANSILLAKGYGFVNQTTLDTLLLDTFTVPFDVHEKEWYNITTILSGGDRISVQINVPLNGAIGFGAYQDQSAWVRNARLYDSANGDFYHTSRIIGASSSQFDRSRDTLSFLLDTQAPNGELSYAASMGYDPSTTIDAFTTGGKYPALEDYQMLGFLGFYHTIKQSNDLQYAAKTWPKWQKQLGWLLTTVNSTDGLVDLDSAFVGANSGGSAVSCLAVEALNGASEVAAALGHSSDELKYKISAQMLAHSINKHLWNDNLGSYSASRSSHQDFGVSDIAWCITSGVANSTQKSKMVSTKVLGELKLGPGYKADTTVSASDPLVSISPNTNGFLLPALFMSNASTTAKDLLVSVWGPMLHKMGEAGIGNDTTSTGASWEYLALDKSPGLSLFTSLGHPWGGAATYVLTEWATGLRPASGPAGFGYNEWLLAPETGVEMGLKKSSAKVVTGSGETLSVSWELTSTSESLRVNIDAPQGTTGTVQFRGSLKTFVGGKRQSTILPF
ncbi:alpha-L-rhamnosidase [Penicillium cosmopolitanum]|uniref:Alpha-L-rhamnosidase n=1 Tax=Penicillium cosmopolitanum TaxID=1131564 RepID=A0A9X0B4Q9_9EURO|nr:alpha-L-rhamnosidase [Penicillium cosmopolitanum]KAJ5388025.1 alpha-L-rhamnosidase [Penicillium cosmopolitanum]